MQERSQALEKFGKNAMASFSSEQQAAFAKMQAERQAEIQRIQSDTSLSLSEKVAAIQQVEQKAMHDLQNIQGDVLVTDGEVEALHAKMTTASKDVGNAISSVQDELSAVHILELEGAREQSAALAARTAALKQATLDGMGKTDAALAGEIDSVLHESEARIKAIMQEEGLTQAEMQQAIAQVD